MAVDARDVAERFRSVIESGDLDGFIGGLDELATDDFVEEWPQSGERIRGKDRVRRLNESYRDATGTNPRFAFRRLHALGDTFVVEATIDYGDGTPVSYVGIGEVRDGKLAKMTEYFANPFEAPAWRADIVERMEPAAV